MPINCATGTESLPFPLSKTRNQMKSPNAVPQFGKIAERARKYAKHSWEYGAVSHALLEIYDPTLSPFFGDFCSLEELDDDKIQQATGLKYAKEFICTGQATLLDGEGTSPKLFQ